METTDEVRCGYPTRTNAPCRQVVRQPGYDGYPPLPACPIHLTDEAKARYEADVKLWRSGYDRGSKSDESMSEHYKSRYEEARAELDALRKAMSEAGRRFGNGVYQYVTVGRYAYRWRGTPDLEVGEKVVLPGNWVTEARGDSGPNIGEVTELGSLWTGTHADIIRRA